MLMSLSQASARLAHYERQASEDEFDRCSIRYTPRVLLEVFHDDGDYAYLLSENWIDKSTAVKTIMSFEEVTR